MNQIISISAITVTTAICCVVLRKQVPEIVVVLTIACGTLVIGLISTSFDVLSDFLAYMEEKSGLTMGIFSPAFKVTGIAMITRMAGDICKDAQESGLASFLEIGGTILALAATVPLVKTVLSTIYELI